MRAAVAGLRALNPGIDVVVTSPFTRAAATADLVVRGLPNSAKLVTSSALEPDKAPADVAQDLASVKAESLALVGHEPGIGQLAAWLLGARHPLPFKKGGMCRIDLDSWPLAAGRGTLIWLAAPRMLRALAGE
jgi:phosphohistidine phosphatase